MRLLLLLLAAAWLWPATLPAAYAQQPVQRCTSLSGKTIYTDKHCEDIGAIDRLPAPTPDASTHTPSGLYRSACSRTLSDLVLQITSAIDAGDVNRLAAVYRWNGVSDTAANRILDQLQAVVQRPLVDIVPIRPPTPLLADDGSVMDPNHDGYYPHTVPQRPIALRLQQTLKNSATPSSTVLNLHQAYKCFWITL